MNTPAGKECRHYYADFHRGHSREECRLLDKNPHSPAWKPKDCSQCPVPDILRANASEYLELHATVKIGLLGIGRRVHVQASCRKHEQAIQDPYVGCAQCAAERPGIVNLLTGSE